MRHHVRLGFKISLRQLKRLIRNPLFIFITIAGNSLVVLGAACLYFFEHDHNPEMPSFFEAFYLAMTTIATVGYGDVHPMTVGGRITSMLMMIGGTGLFLTYIAMLTSLFSEIEMAEIERELEEIKTRMKR